MFESIINAFRGAKVVIEEKASIVYAKVANVTGRSLQRAGEKYEQFAQEGYKINPIVRNAIDLKASAIADTKWKLIRGSGDNAEEITGHPLLDLLSNPNPAQTKESFWQQAVVFGEHGGSIFLHAVSPSDKKTNTSKLGSNQEVVEMRAKNASPPKELYTYRPDIAEIKAGRFGFPSAYVFDNDITILVDPTNGKGAVHHIKYANPLDGTPFGTGIAPVRSIAYQIDQYNEAVKWNTNAIQHSTTPNGWWEHTGEEPLDPETFQEAKQRISEMYSGPTNAHRTLVLDQWKFNSFNMPATDMDWMNLINGAARSIALGLKVPPQLLGIPGDNTYSNYEQAALAFWTMTMIPMINRLTSELNAWLVPMFGDDIKLVSDLDSISALTSVRREQWETVAKSDVLTVNEKRSALGFDAIDNEEANQIFVPANALPLGFDSETLEEMKTALELDGYSSKAAEDLAHKLMKYGSEPTKGADGIPDMIVNEDGLLMAKGDDGQYYKV